MLHIPFQIFVRLGVQFRRPLHRLLGFGVASCRDQRLRERLIRDRHLRIERDRRLGHLDGVIGAAHGEIGLGEIVADAWVERVAIHCALIRRDGLFLPSERVIGRSPARRTPPADRGSARGTP